MLNLIVAAAHEPLDGEDRVAGIGDLLMPGGLADEPVALVGEPDDGGRRPISGRVDDDGRAVALHDCNHGVGGSEVDSDNLGFGF